MSRATDGPPGALRVRFTGEEHKPLVVLRARVTAWLAASEVLHQRGDDLLLVVTELVHNAFRHGAPGPTTVALTRVERPRAVELTVENPAPAGAIPEPSAWRLPAGWGGSGRGLAIVAALVDNCRVEHHRGRVRVTVRITSS